MRSLAEVVGQRFIYGFHGKDIHEPAVSAIAQSCEKGLVSGLIFFSYNIASPSQIQPFLSGFNAIASYPLFMCIDQEGGQVQRLKSAQGFTDYPSFYSQAHGSLEACYLQNAQLAQELHAYGFNVNFTPVVDLHSVHSKIIGQKERAFSARPDDVIAYAREVIKAHRHAYVASCLKHFPGHGLVPGDSHEDLVDVTDFAKDEEYVPYKILIKEEMVDMVMSAHALNRRVDDKLPASLSLKFLKGFLRAQLGYKGLIISDDLHMGAIQRRYRLQDAVIQALKAGNDLIILSNNPAAAVGWRDFVPDAELPHKVVQWVSEAVKSGDLSYQELEEGTQRILDFKTHFYNQHSLGSSQNMA